MFSYQFHIGDFNRETRHLTRLERGIYRDMLDIYYETEKPLPLDIERIFRLVVAISNEERTAVEQVLNEFFHKNELGYAQVRCELEIERYKTNTTQKSEAGKRSAEARAAKRQEIINGRSTGVKIPLQRNVNVESTNQSTSTSQPVSQSLSVTPSATPKKSTGCRLAEDWKPTKEYWDEAILIKPDLTREWFLEIAHGFKDYWIAKTGKDATKANWLATWRNWLRNEVKKNAGFKQPSGAGRSKEKISHADRVRQEARLELQRIDQEAGHDAVYENGGLVREQSSKSEFDHLF